MKKPIQISIPTPCHENWDTMTSEAKGRFCSSCQKSVIDFTQSSDREIASVLKSNKNTCGRFKTSQLERELIVPKEKSTIWMAASAAVIGFLTIGNHTISAQTQVNTEQTDSKTDDIIGDTIVIIKSNRIINGVVKDSEGMVIPGVNIMLSGSKKVAKTDYDGSFSIEANQGEIIQFTFPGMIQQEVEIKNLDTLNIFLVEEIVIIDDDIFMGVVAPLKHRTFFGRIFHSIGSIFR